MSARICHCLVGPPSSGKTTFAGLLAGQLQAQGQPCHIISADQIRQTLYGDVAIQGAWSEIEPVLLDEMQQALQAGQTIIYDATNAYRGWRQSLTLKLGRPGVVWVAWALTTPIETCLAWNLTRARHVPQAIIEEFAQALKRFPVVAGEDFMARFALDPSQPSREQLIALITKHLRTIPRSEQNRKNRHHHLTPHAYSRLLDFDRLLHLLSLLIRYPGLGNFRHGNPAQLQRLLNTETLPPLVNAFDEIAAVLAVQYHEIYGDIGALQQDLAWLETHGFLGQEIGDTPLTMPLPAPAEFTPHRYSDWLCFLRLMSTLRYILQNPLAQAPSPDSPLQSKQSMVEALATQLHQARILASPDAATLRKDIQLVFNPYQLLPDKTLRKGYCLGTGILTQEDLLRVYHLAQKQVQGLDDVMDRATLERFEQRLRWAQLDLEHYQPVRAISSGSIVNPNYLNQESLAQPAALTELEAHIRQAHKIRINRRKGAAQFASYPSQEEEVWPLEIIFHSIAWYLGYEIAARPNTGLLRYERLDRLFQTTAGPYQKRAAPPHQQARQRIATLREYSAGIFLGTDPAEQAKFSNLNHAQRLKAMPKLELQFTEPLFRFISEGTQRFPLNQIEMSRTQEMSQFLKPDLQAIYKLPKAQDPSHPYRFQVRLPCWSFQDVTLKAWVLGFGPGVKVIKPEPFREWIAQELHQAQQLYPHPKSV